MQCHNGNELASVCVSSLGITAAVGKLVRPTGKMLGWQADREHKFKSAVHFDLPFSSNILTYFLWITPAPPPPHTHTHLPPPPFPTPPQSRKHQIVSHYSLSQCRTMWWCHVCYSPFSSSVLWFTLFLVILQQFCTGQAPYSPPYTSLPPPPPPSFPNLGPHLRTQMGIKQNQQQ